MKEGKRLLKSVSSIRLFYIFEWYEFSIYSIVFEKRKKLIILNKKKKKKKKKGNARKERNRIRFPSGLTFHSLMFVFQDFHIV
jgi:hypothetical protein